MSTKTVVSVMYIEQSENSTAVPLVSYVHANHINAISFSMYLAHKFWALNAIEI